MPIVLAVVGLAAPAFADPKGDIQAKSKEAMKSYDSMDYDAAKESLNKALDVAKKAKLDKDPAVAKVHLYLGIVSFVNGEADAAKSEFAAAVAIDPKIQIEAAYKSPELTKLLEQVKSDGGGGAPAGPSDGTDCASVKGFQHSIIDSAKGGVPGNVEVLVGPELKPDHVSVQFRAKEQADFTEVKLTKQGACKYVGQIPAAAMRGEFVYYYVAAYDSGNRILGSKGASGAPNMIEITAGGGGAKVGPSDGEDPINGGGGGGASGGNVAGGVIAGGKQPKVFVAVAGGTGFGYVTGNTEGGNTVQNCCIGNSLVVATPELGYYVNEKLSIGVAARLGFPIGANVNAKDADGHSTIAPAGLLRVRYGLTGAEGLRVMGQLGYGIMRNTIKLEEQMGGGDTDIVGQGPLLVGAGIGYTKKLSGNVAFLADFSALGGIAIVKEMAGLQVNNGVSGDLSLGLAFGF